MSVAPLSASEIGTFAAVCTKNGFVDSFETAVEIGVIISKGNAEAYSARYSEMMFPESYNDIYNEALTVINDPSRMIHDRFGPLAYNMLESNSAVEMIRGLEKKCNEWRAVEIAKAEKAEREAEISAMKNTDRFPHLTKADDNNGGSKLAAKNIRIELKRNFPGIKFSVRTDHNSVRITWSDGPSPASVKAFTSRHESGTFDSMTDCPGWAHNPFGMTFGECRYVNEVREVSTETLEVVAKSYAEKRGCEFNSMNDRPLKDHHHSYWDVARIIAGGHDIPKNHKVVGVERTEKSCGSWVAYHEFFKIVTEEIPSEECEAATKRAKGPFFTEEGYLATKAYPKFSRNFRKEEVADREVAKLKKKGIECEIVFRRRYGAANYSVKKVEA